MKAIGHWLPALLVLVGAGCQAPAVMLEGKQCGPTHSCGHGLLCNPYMLTCAREALCPYLPPTPRTCAGRDLYLSPNGDDSQPGTAPSSPRQTLANIALSAGDTIHLAPGHYPGFVQDESGDLATCPISLIGTAPVNAATGATDFQSVLDGPLILSGSYWRVADLAIQASSAFYGLATVAPVEGITVEHSQFSATGERLAPNPLAAHVQFFSCGSCTITSNSFTGVVPALIASYGSVGLVFRGNRVRLDSGRGGQVQINDPGALIEANEFSGAAEGIAFQGSAIGTGRVVRNVFHDMINFFVDRGEKVTSNTFIRLTEGGVLGPKAARTAGASPEFRNNILKDVAIGLAASAETSTGYNLSDNSTLYQDQGTQDTDRSGASLLGPDFMPSADSPAIAGADPSLPVPAGGGTRADIGAFQRGATRLPDGRYCLP